MVKVAVAGGQSVVYEGRIILPDKDGKVDVTKEVADSLKERGLLATAPPKGKARGKAGAEPGESEEPEGGDEQ